MVRISRLPYPVLCGLLGIVLGWTPVLFHGPIPAKFDRFFINGHVAVWTFYLARLLIGWLVGITLWPRPWYLRGPLCGLLMLIPPGFFLLATPGCGPT